MKDKIKKQLLDNTDLITTNLINTDIKLSYQQNKNILHIRKVDIKKIK